MKMEAVRSRAKALKQSLMEHVYGADQETENDHELRLDGAEYVAMEDVVDEEEARKRLRRKLCLMIGAPIGAMMLLYLVLMLVRAFQIYDACAGSADKGCFTLDLIELGNVCANETVFDIVGTLELPYAWPSANVKHVQVVIDDEFETSSIVPLFGNEQDSYVRPGKVTLRNAVYRVKDAAKFAELSWLVLNKLDMKRTIGIKAAIQIYPFGIPFSKTISVDTIYQCKNGVCVFGEDEPDPAKDNKSGSLFELVLRKVFFNQVQDIMNEMNLDVSSTVTINQTYPGLKGTIPSFQNINIYASENDQIPPVPESLTRDDVYKAARIDLGEIRPRNRDLDVKTKVNISSISPNDLQGLQAIVNRYVNKDKFFVFVSFGKEDKECKLKQVTSLLKPIKIDMSTNNKDDDDNGNNEIDKYPVVTLQSAKTIDDDKLKVNMYVNLDKMFELSGQVPEIAMELRTKEENVATIDVDERLNVVTQITDLSALLNASTHSEVWVHGSDRAKVSLASTLLSKLSYSLLDDEEEDSRYFMRRSLPIFASAGPKDDALAFAFPPSKYLHVASDFTEGDPIKVGIFDGNMSFAVLIGNTELEAVTFLLEKVDYTKILDFNAEEVHFEVFKEGCLDIKQKVRLPTRAIQTVSTHDEEKNDTAEASFSVNVRVQGSIESVKPKKDGDSDHGFDVTCLSGKTANCVSGTGLRFSDLVVQAKTTKIPAQWSASGLPGLGFSISGVHVTIDPPKTFAGDGSNSLFETSISVGIENAQVLRDIMWSGDKLSVIPLHTDSLFEANIALLANSAFQATEVSKPSPPTSNSRFNVDVGTSNDEITVYATNDALTIRSSAASSISVSMPKVNFQVRDDDHNHDIGKIQWDAFTVDSDVVVSSDFKAKLTLMNLEELVTESEVKQHRFSVLSHHGSELKVKVDIMVNENANSHPSSTTSTSSISYGSVEIVDFDGPTLRIPCIVPQICPKNTGTSQGPSQAIKFRFNPREKVTKWVHRVTIPQLDMRVERLANVSIHRSKSADLKTEGLLMTVHLGKDRVLRRTLEKIIDSVYPTVVRARFLSGPNTSYLQRMLSHLKISSTFEASSPDGEPVPYPKPKQWWFPLASVGAWNLEYTTATAIHFLVNAAIPNPVPLGINFRNVSGRASLVVVGDGTMDTTKEKVTKIGDFAIGDITLPANKTTYIPGKLQVFDFAETLQRVVDQQETRVGMEVQFLTGNGVQKSARLDAMLFEGEEKGGRIRPYKAPPRFLKDLPTAADSSAVDEFISLFQTVSVNGWSTVWKSMIQEGVYLSVQVILRNVLAFPFTVDSFRVRLDYHDPTGEYLWYMPQFYDPMVSKSLVNVSANNVGLTIQSNETKPTPKETVHLVNGKEELACRLYNAAEKVQQFCVSIPYGEVGLRVGNYSWTQKMKLFNVSVVGQNACIFSPPCRVSFEDEMEPKAFSMQGSAKFEDDSLILTTGAVRYEVGSAWIKDAVNTSNGFDAEFDFTLNDTGTVGGGDGFAFVVQTESDHAIGSRCENTPCNGYYGLKGPSFGVLLYRSTTKHIEVHLSTQGLSNSIGFGSSRALFPVADNKPHKMRIYYARNDRKLFVSVDGTDLISANAWEPGLVDTGKCSAGNASPEPDYCVDMDEIGKRKAYVGFTASSGLLYASKQVISNFTFKTEAHVDTAKTLLILEDDDAEKNQTVYFKVDFRDNCGGAIRHVKNQAIEIVHDKQQVNFQQIMKDGIATVSFFAKTAGSYEVKVSDKRIGSIYVDDE